DVPSPLVYDGLVYLCDEGGIVSCLDAQTGQEYYGKQRLHADRYRASPVYADGKIYFSSRDGNITVIKAGKQFEVLSINDMGEGICSSPLVANGTLYVRTFDGLYAVRDPQSTLGFDFSGATKLLHNSSNPHAVPHQS